MIRVLTCLIIGSSFSFSQEVVSDLISNDLIINNKRITYCHKSPISIPFVDDFSNQSSYPDSLLWQENLAFINRNYAINPITVGVATFDGLDANGRAYDINSVSMNSQAADTLTSQYVDLSSVDTVYLLFFYQPQGIGNDPQIGDSLILEFSNGVDSLGNIRWNRIWAKKGSPFHEFKKVSFVFSDTAYLRSDFQFRFRNLATITGNFDHWHIDYVKLDVFHNSSDTMQINDVSFVYSAPRLLERYREIPWIHFVNDVTNEMNDSIDVLLRNNTKTIQSIDYRYDVYKDNNLVYHYPVLGGNNSARNVMVAPYDSIGNYLFNNPSIMLDDQMFPVNSNDSAEFIFVNSIKTEPSDRKENDTLYHLQKFYSHFAYDDGSSEVSYGINVQGAKIAYAFKLNRPDTIRMIQFKFVEMHDDFTNHSFLLTIWSNNNGLPSTVLYQDTVQIQYKDRGKYLNFYLKNGVGLVGDFFIGWEQISDEILNLGLDKNSIANQYMLYNIGGGWANSQFPGAWMIRPVVNYDFPLVSSFSSNISKIDLKIYPNPFIYKTSIYFEKNNNRIITIYDLMGRNLRSITTSERKVDIYKEYLKKGIYFIRILEDNIETTKKIIIN